MIFGRPLELVSLLCSSIFNSMMYASLVVSENRVTDLSQRACRLSSSGTESQLYGKPLNPGKPGQLIALLNRQKGFLHQTNLGNATSLPST